MYRKSLRILALFAFPWYFQGNPVYSQNFATDASITISEVVENEISSDDEVSDPEIIAGEMYSFLDHPLNLNTANADELRKLHILTEFQIYSLLEYIKENGELLSVYELQLVYGFDRQLTGKLIPFICLSPPQTGIRNRTKINKYFGQSVIFRTGFDTDKKAGFTPDSSGNSSFTGSNRAIMLRYEAEISGFIFGFTMDQDAGESFRSGGKVFKPDFLSAFLEYQSQSLIKKFIIGDYKVSWGQGLVLGGYGTRKGTQVLLSPQTTGLKKYSSAGENNFFRGAAATLGWRNLSLDILASRLKIDAGIHELTEDTTISVYFTSPDLSGLHRSSKELAKKDAVLANSFGGHAQITAEKYTLGAGYLSQNFSHEWIRNTTAYTTDTLESGKNLQNFGMDFKVSLGKIAIFGELASDNKTRTAFFTGFLAELHPLIRLSMAYRKYHPGYLGIKSSGFGESSGTKNEEGYYLGLQMYPWKYVKVDFYADRYSFPFLRYTSTSPYSGNDYLLNLEFYPSRQFIINMRLRYEKNCSRSSEGTVGIDRMEAVKKSSCRLELKYELSDYVSLKSRLEFNYLQSGRTATTKGFYSGHDLGFNSVSGRYKLWLRYAMYDIPDWDNRIYAYENDVLYSFSVPAFNSKGTRFILMGKAEVFPGLELSIRYALSQFRGIKTRGTGDDAVSSGKDAYWTIQLRYKI